VSAVAGQAVQFTVEASGSPPLSFQWHRDGAPVVGATSSTLPLASVRAADAAKNPGYTVTVSNAAGTVTGGPAALTLVETAPIRLGLQYWRENDFPDRPTGTGQWIEEWVWIDAHWEETGHWEDTDGDGVEDTWVIDGRVWVPAEMRLESRWQEDIAADGLLGSQWATTTGEYGPPETSPSTGITTADVERGHVLESYRPGAADVAMRAWALAPDGNCGDFRFAVFQPDGSPTGLAGVIPAGGFADIRLPTWRWGTGFYRLELSYGGATATPLAAAKATHWIAIGQGIPPRIVRHPGPTTQRVPAGTPVSYKVTATSVVTYQWLKDGVPLPGATQATVTLPAVTIGQSGIYRVHAINSAGRTVSDPVTLQVEAGASADADGDGIPDSIERMLGMNANAAATPDSANTALRLRINLP